MSSDAAPPILPIRSSVLSSARFALLFVILGLGLLSCDTTSTQPEAEIVVEGYLQAKSPLSPIRLSRTVSADARYDPAETAVRDADVEVQRLTDDSTVAERVPYTERDSVPGLYAPTRAVPVEFQSLYRLVATLEEGSTVTSTTRVPGPVDIVRVENDTTVYRTKQPSFTVDVDRSLDRQNVFTFTTTSLLNFEETPDSTLRENLTCFSRNSFDPSEDSLESLRSNASNLLNEGNFTRNEDGTITIDYPWFAVNFFGPNRVGINILDDNYYDLLRSQQAQETGFAPGEIPNVIEHVNGGTGIFGSFAQTSHPIFVQPPPPPRCP